LAWQQTDNQLRTAIGTARQQRHQQRAGNLAQNHHAQQRAAGLRRPAQPVLLAILLWLLVRVPAAPDAAQVTLPPLWPPTAR
jgi:Flp pilus assembly protein TadB